MLAVSERTQRDLVELYGIPHEKIVLTPNGVDPAFTPERPAPNGAPYALFVGALQPRKDPLAAVEALALLGDGAPARRSSARTRAAAPAAERAADRPASPTASTSAATSAGRARRALPRRRLPRLPVALRGLRPADRRGDGLRHARRDHRGRRAARGRRRRRDPGRGANPVALAGGIERALADRERLVAAGLERARRFSWAETARRTLAVYRELL